LTASGYLLFAGFIAWPDFDPTSRLLASKPAQAAIEVKSSFILIRKGRPFRSHRNPAGTVFR
jgi:hypothetical protein